MTTLALLSVLAMPVQAAAGTPASNAKPAAKAPAPSHAAAPTIAPERALEIQNALIRAGYLQRSSGVWDAATAAAMQRYQQDHHWQVRFVPDARALIALGLGPRKP